MKPADDEIAFAFGVGLGKLEAEFSIESITSLLANPIAPPAATPTPTPAPVAWKCKYILKTSDDYFDGGVLSDFEFAQFKFAKSQVFPDSYFLVLYGIRTQGTVRFFAIGHNATYSSSYMLVYGPGRISQSQLSSSKFVSVVTQSATLNKASIEIRYEVSGDVTGKPYVDLSCGGV